MREPSFMERTGLRWPEVLILLVSIVYLVFILLATDVELRIPSAK